MYKLFKKNSGSYVKFGQGLVQMEHILPQPFITNLEPLCQEAPITPIDKVKKMIESELGMRFDEIFSSFEEKPLGSASIAQVHKAVLRKSNEEVAVKVQHPMVAIYCPSDVAIVKFATKVGEYLWPGSKLQWMAKEFETNIMKEIDLCLEGKNADRIKNLLKDDIRIVIPDVKWKYTSKKVLTMSFERGRSIMDTNYRLENRIDVNEIAELLSSVFNRQIFEFGFVHSDPHHGNLFIRKENVNGKFITRLVILDHGLYRELDQDFKYNFSLLWRGIFMQNEEIILTACKALNVTNAELFVSIVTNRSYRDIMNSEDKYSTKNRLGDRISMLKI
jgi:aarF domain-containing kinase